MKILSGFGALMLLCGSVSAGELDLGINSDTVRAAYIYDFKGSDLSGDVGFVNNSDAGTVVHASVFIRGFASDGANPLEASLGLRAAYVDGEGSDQTGYPVAVGGAFRYALPQLDRLSLQGSAWLAPSVLSLGDLDKYEDVSIRLQYALLREADVFIGAHYLNAEFSNGSRALIDNGLNAGFNIRF